MKFAILLAAYNGQDFITEQIESILTQKGVDVTIYINVDKSSDATVEIIKAMSIADSRVILLGSNSRFGSAALNFYDLIVNLNQLDYDYFAFSDQDDIWLEHKLGSSLPYFKSGYDCYSSSITALYPDGRTSEIHKVGRPTAFDHFFQSAGPGCTYILNRSAFVALKNNVSANLSNYHSVLSHDWAIYYFCRVNGFKWYIDKRSQMLYRQHNSNEFGANIGFSAFKSRFVKLTTGWYLDQVYNLEPTCSGPGVSKLLGPRPGKLYLWIGHGYQLRRFKIQSLFIVFLRLVNLLK